MGSISRVGERIHWLKRGWHLKVGGKYTDINLRLKRTDSPHKKLRASEATGQDRDCWLVLLLNQKLIMFTADVLSNILLTLRLVL